MGGGAGDAGGGPAARPQAGAPAPIAAGEKVLKYGAPIGTATAAIAAGEHVHVHNIESDYTPTYHLDAARARRAEHDA